MGLDLRAHISELACTNAIILCLYTVALILSISTPTTMAVLEGSTVLTCASFNGLIERNIQASFTLQSLTATGTGSTSSHFKPSGQASPCN